MVRGGWGGGAVRVPACTCVYLCVVVCVVACVCLRVWFVCAVAVHIGVCSVGVCFVVAVRVGARGGSACTCV